MIFFPRRKPGMKPNRIAIAALALGLAIVPCLAANKSQTLTGEISDAMCGAKHQCQAQQPTARAPA